MNEGVAIEDCLLLLDLLDPASASSEPWYPLERVDNTRCGS